MMPGMILRDEDKDPLDGARGICCGIFLSLIFWGLAAAGLARLMGWI